MPPVEFHTLRVDGDCFPVAKPEILIIDLLPAPDCGLQKHPLPGFEIVCK
jgi:hypothetical protein